jgi:hypothetical protein
LDIVMTPVLRSSAQLAPFSVFAACTGFTAASGSTSAATTIAIATSPLPVKVALPKYALLGVIRNSP